jgi:hypothetical protein
LDDGFDQAGDANESKKAHEAEETLAPRDKPEGAKKTK